MHECLAGAHGWRWFVSGVENSYSATSFSVQLRLKFPFDWSYIPNWLYSTTESEKLETIDIKITFKLLYQTPGVSTRLAVGKIRQRLGRRYASAPLVNEARPIWWYWGCPYNHTLLVL